MKRIPEKNPDTPDAVRDRLIGLGEGSIRKSYYPELRLHLDELQRMHAYLASVLDAVPSAILGVDAEMRVTRANRAAGELAGMPHGELEGRLLVDVYPELRRHLERAARAVAEGLSMKRLGAEAYEGKSTRFFDIAVSPIEAGKTAVIRMDEVTERVRLDQLIVQTEKMVSLGGLAAGMAHEINNPLGGILQGAQNIKLRLDPTRVNNIRAAEEAGCSVESFLEYARKRGILRFLEGIQESGKRAAVIVRHMLDFSRAADARHTEEDLAEVVDAALALVASDFGLDSKTGFRRIKLERNYQGDMPRVLMARGEIEQVVFNLIKNAAEAMAGAGIQEPRISFAIRREGARAVLEVSDNGPGMDDATRRRVFDPFFTTKEVGEGTGLGLSVSYFIVTTNHCGEFAVDSRPGKGSRFVVRLPL